MTAPNILEFQSISDFLNAHNDHRKALSKTWSLQVWARKLKLRSKTALLRAVNGSRPVSAGLEKILLAYFKWPALESDYFRILAAYSRMKARESTIDIRGVLKAKNNATEARVLRVPEELKEIFTRPMSNWLRTMAHGRGLPVDRAALLKQFRIAVDPQEVFEVLERLVSAGLLVKNNAGDRWQLTDTNIIWATANELGRREANIKQLHYMEAVRKRLEGTLETETEERVRTFTVTLKISAEDLPAFSRQIHDSVCAVAATFESAGGEITFQAQCTGLHVAVDEV